MADTLNCRECYKKPIRCKGLCKTCYSRYINRKIRQSSGISITSLQKGWSQTGGANNGYKIRDERKEWNCQACGIEQPSQISPNLFPFLESEVLRICPLCQNLVNNKNISDFARLLKLVR